MIRLYSINLHSLYPASSSMHFIWFRLIQPIANVVGIVYHTHIAANTQPSFCMANILYLPIIFFNHDNGCTTCHIWWQRTFYLPESIIYQRNFQGKFWIDLLFPINIWQDIFSNDTSQPIIGYNTIFMIVDSIRISIIIITNTRKSFPIIIRN